MIRKVTMLLLVSFLLFTISCSINNTGEQQTPSAPQSTPGPGNTEIMSPKVNPADIKANEVGKVMILMYHIIGAEKEGDWAQTAENFQRDLATLFEQGYSLIGLNDFVENNISVPAGRSPVIITFDDGTAGQFNYLITENNENEINPKSAVGIMLEFAKKHPEFGSVATFFINDRPFGAKQDWQEKMRKLVELGFEIGNHTLTHPRLDRISDVETQKEIVGLARLVEKHVPSYKVKTLALPFGIMPSNRELAVKGIYDDYEYEHIAVLRVGANPALSPNSKGFDPSRLPRIKASTIELEKWLKYFENNPNERYISDGDPMTIAVPKEKEDLISVGSLGTKTLLLW